MRGIKIDALADEVNKALVDYQKVTTDELKDTIKKAGKDAAKEIKQTAPKKSGKYAKSWTSRAIKETATNIEVSVYSSSRYQLAHLLEHGHALRGGGRAKAIPHIAPAEENAERQIESELRRKLGG